MRTISRIKLINIIGVFAFITFCFPQNGMAQRFGHGGGGGGSHGGGGGFSRSSAPAAGRGGFGGGGFNGGARNIGSHSFPAPAARGGYGGRVGGYGGGARFTDHAYHSGYGYGHIYGGGAYFYHPYHPYVWGPYWHPFGYFAASLAADALYFSIANQAYYYDNGVYYEPSGSGYTAVAPPVGAVVSYLPNGYVTVPVGDVDYYYYGGAFYVNQGNSFRVVPAPVGAIVTEIPQGATEQQINGQDVLLYNNTYYQPISQNGQDAYQVIQVQ